MILTGFSFFSAIAIAYALLELISIILAANDGEPTIAIETSIYYVFILNIFFVFSFIQYRTNKNPNDKVNDYAGKLIATCFTASLITAFITPIVLDDYLIDKGYVKQLEPLDNAFEKHRLFAGESLVYKKLAL